MDSWNHITKEENKVAESGLIYFNYVFSLSVDSSFMSFSYCHFALSTYKPNW